MEKNLAVFDFDWTIIDENSDFIARNLLPPEVVKARLKTIKDSRGWTAYMDEVFKLLKEEGITVEKLRESIVNIPPVPNFVDFFYILKGFNYDIIIISDSNTYFIEEWLRNKGIRDIVHSVYSNPAHISNGRLHILPYHDQDWCKLSTRNLCKGYILQTHIKNEEEKDKAKYKTIFYAGDGHNDLCPSLKLREIDYVFPRKGFNLDKELIAAGSKLKAKIVPWENTDDIWTIVKDL